jgi:hypothetical protein
MPFLTTTTGSSADDLVSLLHLTTDHRVRLVSCRPTTSPPHSQHSPQTPVALQSVPLSTKWPPSPNHCWPVHRMSCPSRGWLFFRPADLAETMSLFERRLHLRVFLTESPLLTKRVATSGSPDTPLGFVPTPGFHPSIPLATHTTEMAEVLFEARPKSSPSRPRTRRSEFAIPTTSSLLNLLTSTLTAEAAVALAQGLKTVHAVSHMPPRCKHRTGAPAFRGTSLPMAA